ncbi:hypothetical protein, partial [Clostridium sp.]|uniref:hypothetical protein n=1 Tax=Clostridium sp. TaxID=1506 RepID=UPI002849A01E
KKEKKERPKYGVLEPVEGGRQIRQIYRKKYLYEKLTEFASPPSTIFLLYFISILLLLLK